LGLTQAFGVIKVKRNGHADAAELSTTELTVHFRGLKALEAVDLTLGRHEILGLIGPNGAGKTTMVNAISGFQRPTRGSIRLGSTDVTNWPPHILARAGVVRTFQGLRPVRDLTVRQNIEAAAIAVGAGWGEARSRAAELLKAVRLESQANMKADALPFGAERRLGIARAAATQPTFLLLDEPAAGLSEGESDQLVELIKSLRMQLGCGVLIIEHDMRVIMQLCERIQVLDFGHTIFAGSPAEVQTNPAVIAAYLGSETDDTRAASASS
jgi:branched-chain amino acid transport system ATP-binding protein